MSLRGDLYTKLAATSAVTAIVGNRIYPGEAEQGCKLPYVVFHEIDLGQPRAMNADPSLFDVLEQVSCFAKTYKEAKDLQAVIKTALQDFSGTMGSTQVQRIFFEGQREFREDDSKIWNASVDFRIIHQ